MKSLQFYTLYKVLFCIFLILFTCKKIYSQDQISSDKLLNYKFAPPNPTSSALGKYGEIPVGNYSGIPEIKIPLYTIKTSKLSLSIDLNYRSSGLIVEELAPFSGLNWSLNSGGLITRSVNGLPDDSEFGIHYKKLPASLYDQSLFFYDQIMLGLKDSEPDSYYINFNGISGQLIFLEDGKIVITPYRNLKIEKFIGNDGYSIAAFDVTTEDGALYSFSSIEQSYINGDFSKPLNQSWYVSSITSSDHSENIIFDYTSHDTKSSIIPHQTMYIPETIFDSKCPQRGTVTPIVNISGNALKIASITFPGGKVEFTSEFSRLDLPWEPKLASVQIWNDSEIIKKFQFGYSYFTGNMYAPCINGYDGFVGFNPRIRLKLDNVTECNSYNDCLPSYKFRYIDEDRMPSICSFAQDNWGYYNGQDENTTLIPKGLAAGRSYLGANREPSIRATTGMLYRIDYPNSGYSQIDYENNTYFSPCNLRKVSESVSNHVIYYSKPQNANYNILYAESTFKIAGSLNECPIPGDLRTVSINTYLSAGLGSGEGDIPALDPVAANVEIYRQNSDGSLTNVWSSNYGYPGNIGSGFIKNVEEKTQLPPGDYTLISTIQGNIDAVADANYSATSAVSFEKEIEGEYNIITGGVRVRRITDYSNTNQVAKIKSYQYTKAATFKGKTIYDASSGELHYYPHYSYVYSDLIADDRYWFGIIECNNTVISSVNLNRLGSFQGGVVGYPTAIVLDGENGENGKITHTYSTSGNFNTNAFPFTPPPNNTYTLGLPLKIITSDKNGNVITKVENEYEYNLPNTSNYFAQRGLKVQYLVHSVYSPNNSEWTSEFEKVAYNLTSSWLYMKTSRETNYLENDSITKETKFEYNPTHFQLSKISTNDSKGRIQEEIYKYPGDYIQEVYTKMYNNHLVNIPISIEKKLRIGNNSKTLTLLRVAYKEFQPLSFYPEEIYQLDKINIDESGQESRKMKFYSYSNKGKLLSYSNEGDIVNSYIWGYNQTLPIAEVYNASANEVFQTSFEETGNEDVMAKTGNKSFSGDFNFIPPTNFIPSANSILSYWYWSNSKWNYKETSYSGGAITLSEGEKIDEVRIFPKGAQMVTHTYKPLIGLTSTTSVNNVTTYFEYDLLNRLENLRDNNKNITRNYKYHLVNMPEEIVLDASFSNNGPKQIGNAITFEAQANYPGVVYNWNFGDGTIINNGSKVQSHIYGSPGNYSVKLEIKLGLRTQNSSINVTINPDSSPNWQNSGQFRCKLNYIGENTGEQEKEQTDINIYSNTYQTKRWVSNGINMSACPVCIGINKKIINGNCETSTTSVCLGCTGGGDNYECNYQYTFSDGSGGDQFTVYKDSPCSIE